MRFLFGWFLRFVRLSSRCAGERGPAGRDLPSCGSASRFPAAGAIPGFLVSPELSGDGEPVRHSGRLRGSGKNSFPLSERPIVRKMTCVKRVPTVLCDRPSPFPERRKARNPGISFSVLLPAVRSFCFARAVAADFLLSCRLLSTAGSGYAGDGEPGRCRRTRSPWPGGRFRVACPVCRAVRVRAARDGAVFFSLGPGIGKNGPCAGAAVRVPPPRRVRRPGFPARAAVRIFGACATDTSESASRLRSRPARGVRLQRVRAAGRRAARRAASEHDGLVAPLALRRRSDTYRGKRGRADRLCDNLRPGEQFLPQLFRRGSDRSARGAGPDCTTCTICTASGNRSRCAWTDCRRRSTTACSASGCGGRITSLCWIWRAGSLSQGMSFVPAGRSIPHRCRSLRAGSPRRSSDRLSGWPVCAWNRCAIRLGPCRRVCRRTERPGRPC